MESERAPQERIDDPAKAEHVAYASKDLRDGAVEMRKEADTLNKRAISNDARAENFENLAGPQFEERQRVQALNDGELTSELTTVEKDAEFGTLTYVELEREAFQRGIRKHDELVHGDSFIRGNRPGK